MVDKMCDVYCLNFRRVFKEQNDKIIALVDSCLDYYSAKNDNMVGNI
jgi:hypothetical protein